MKCVAIHPDLEVDLAFEAPTLGATGLKLARLAPAFRAGRSPKPPFVSLDRALNGECTQSHVPIGLANKHCLLFHTSHSDPRNLASRLLPRKASS